jgi:hypothetical protein
MQAVYVVHVLFVNFPSGPRRSSRAPGEDHTAGGTHGGGQTRGGSSPSGRPGMFLECGLSRLVRIRRPILTRRPRIRKM